MIIKKTIIYSCNHELTQKTSETLLKEFLKLPKDAQTNLVLIKSSQLLLSNILCQVVSDIEELEMMINEQDNDIRELTLNCATTAFADKFNIKKH